MTTDPDELLRTGLEQLGIETTAYLLDSLKRYRRELQKWGRIHNLTSNLSDTAIISKHFLDSFIYVMGFPGTGPLDVADVGSGAGFPGLPLALIRPADQFTLYEPRSKRGQFLRHMIRLLNLRNVKVTEARIQDAGPREAKYDVIMTRALFEPEELVAETRTHIRPGGRWVLSQGPNYHIESGPPDTRLVKRKVTLPIEIVDRWLIILITNGVPRGT